MDGKSEAAGSRNDHYILIPQKDYSYNKRKRQDTPPDRDAVAERIYLQETEAYT